VLLALSSSLSDFSKFRDIGAVTLGRAGKVVRIFYAFLVDFDTFRYPRCRKNYAECLFVCVCVFTFNLLGGGGGA
jgi:hypothetical protein